MARGYKTGGRKKGTPNRTSQSSTPFHLEKIYDKKPTVYLIKCHERYKIGRTNNLSARFFNKAGSSPYPYEHIWHLYINEHALLEKTLHRIFKKQRVHYEWFNLSNDQVEQIKKIRSMDDVIFISSLYSKYEIN